MLITILLAALLLWVFFEAPVPTILLLLAMWLAGVNLSYDTTYSIPSPTVTNGPEPLGMTSYDRKIR